MRLAVISDIHGNLDAFNQVLADIDRSKVDEIICLGDNIGYGPEPDQVIKTVQARRISSVIGNHELAVIQPKFLKWFNPVARKSIQKSLPLLSERSLSYISKQKSFFVAHGCRFVHGFPPDSALIYMFQVSEHRKRLALKNMRENVCFVGHTHMLEMIRYDGLSCDTKSLNEGITDLEYEEKYIFNIGSVGQPRDGDNRAKYAIWDVSDHTLEIRSVPYDIGSVVDKMKKAGLPEAHARRLW
jgi:predicted phosphodiesterase